MPVPVNGATHFVVSSPRLLASANWPDENCASFKLSVTPSAVRPVWEKARLTKVRGWLLGGDMRVAVEVIWETYVFNVVLKDAALLIWKNMSLSVCFFMPILIGGSSYVHKTE